MYNRKFGESLATNSKEPLKYVSLNNQHCQNRPTGANINSNHPLYYSFTVSVDKCGWNYNTIDDSCAGICFPNKEKKMNVKVSNLMSGANETRFLVQYEFGECECGLNESVYNSKQKWIHDECWCKCKELDDWSCCRNDCMWNASTCCESNKACKTEEYLDTKNCSCKKRLFGKLVVACEDEI